MTRATRLSSSVSRPAAADKSQGSHRKGASLLVLVICALIALAGVFAVSAGVAGPRTLELTCLPIAPREGQPILLHLTLRNLGLFDDDYAFSVYVNGEAVAEGMVLIGAQSSREISYIAPAEIPVGESLKVYAEAQSLGSLERYEERVQIPPSPPEIWSSFSSFASFSMGQRNHMTTFGYYMSFAAGATIFNAVNAGVMVTVSLLVVLVFLQVSDSSWRRLGARTLSMRRRYGWLAAALLAIFGCMIFTKIVLMIAGLG